MLKEFRGDSSKYGFPNDSPHPEILETGEMREVPNLVQNPRDLYINSTSSYREDNTGKNEVMSEINPFPGNHSEHNTGIRKKLYQGKWKQTPPLHNCIEDDDIDIET